MIQSKQKIKFMVKKSKDNFMALWVMCQSFMSIVLGQELNLDHRHQVPAHYPSAFLLQGLNFFLLETYCLILHTKQQECHEFMVNLVYLTFMVLVGKI